MGIKVKTAKFNVICLLAAITACAAPDLLAQFPPGGGGFPGGGMRGGRHRPDGSGKDKRPAIQENTADLVEYRLELLQEDLKLAPGQENAWIAYADKVRALTSDILRERSRAPTMDAPTNALQQMDHAVDVARDRLTALEDIATAAKVLYASLNPEQKMLADSRFATIVPLIEGSAPAGAGNRMMQQGNGPYRGRENTAP